MIEFVPARAGSLERQLAVMNSNPAFNRLSKNADELGMADFALEYEETMRAGAERYLVQDDGTTVGLIEWLMRNPNDGYPWLGLLVIDRAYQRMGYGKQALLIFEEEMRRRSVSVIRLGVLVDNAPALRFWQGAGFKEVDRKRMIDGNEVFVYEKSLAQPMIPDERILT